MFELPHRTGESCQEVCVELLLDVVLCEGLTVIVQWKVVKVGIDFLEPCFELSDLHSHWFAKVPVHVELLLYESFIREHMVSDFV